MIPVLDATTLTAHTLTGALGSHGAIQLLHPLLTGGHAQRMQQAIGRGVQQQPQAVGDEARARQPVGVQRVFEVLDEVLCLPPRGVGRVDLGRRVRCPAA